MSTNDNEKEKKLFYKGRVFEMTVGIDDEFNRNLDGQKLESINARYLTLAEIDHLYAEICKIDDVKCVAVTIHDRDQKPSGNDLIPYEPDYHHAHIDVLINHDSNAWSLAKVKRTYQDITGKEIFSDFVAQSQMHEQNAPDMVKFSGMVVYATHDIKTGSGRPDELHHISCTSKEWDWNKMYWLYDPSEVRIYGTTVSHCFDVFAEFVAGASERARQRAEDDRLMQLLDDIGTGRIREWQLADPNVCSVYEFCRMKTGVNGMKLDHALERFYNSCLLAAKSGNYKQAHVYVHGDSGSGKTTYAVEWCRKHNLSYYIASAGKHPFDDYKGEDVIVMDDWRSSSMEFVQFLETFDNNNPRSAAARYYNRCIACARFVFFTSVVPIENCYPVRLEDAKEDRKQFRRRIPTYIDIKDDTVTWHNYDLKRDEYVPVRKCKWNFDAVEYFNALKQTIDNDPMQYLYDNFAVPGMVGEELPIDPQDVQTYCPKAAQPPAEATPKEFYETYDAPNPFDSEPESEPETAPESKSESESVVTESEFVGDLSESEIDTSWIGGIDDCPLDLFN